MKENNELLASAKLTSKGQITIPKIVRETLNIEEGDSVIFYLDEKKNIKISNQGGIIACRCLNNNVKNYQSDAEEINPSELLKKAGITEEELKINLAFYLTITLESGKQYQAEIKTELPTGNVVEEGNTSTEITDLKDVVFKRTHT